MPRVLNMAKFWICQGSQYESVTQRSEYTRLSLDRVLNIFGVLNMQEFWIWQISEYARVTKGSKHNMADYVWIGCEYPWICLNRVLNMYQAIYSVRSPLRKKCSYSELFWSASFPHFPAFGCGKMREKCWPE